jgi:exonuclease III
LEKKFFQRGYEIKHKSEKASRGVGILWKRGLGVNVVSQYSDSKDNFLFLKIKLRGVQILLGSIYGPNKNENEFFDKINEILGENTGTPTIIGGDFNATWDCRDATENIDILNMTNIPSKFRSEKINWLANNNNLTDPYRYIYPSRKEFTYVPNARLQLNRSRIDYFLVSTALCGGI